eukprot:TRINITY_DN10886_c1_g1_i1.p1 TRINITY_DN10886_c1_g1~~TRINITY_DN10886_c1_g1_i1.p1  ORF type:complete len:229 (+),score=1.33 TRINITY_DN10886_c1_g1_i1:154-840(+)
MQEPKSNPTSITKQTRLKFQWKHVNLEVKIVQLDKTQIQQAQKLLYQVYVKEQKWDVNRHPNNPSGLYADHGNEKLIDKIDESNPCYYFGALHKGEVVATIRLVLPNKDGSLEIDRYTYIPTLLRGRKLCELNRSAVSAKWRTNGLIFQLIGTALEKAYNTYDCEYAIGSSPRTLAKVYELVFRSVSVYEFKYQEDDPFSSFQVIDLAYLASNASFQTPLIQKLRSKL